MIRVLFLQQQPCVRAMKYAVGLAGEVELGFAYRGRTLTEVYGAGDELFEAWYPLGDDPAAEVKLAQGAPVPPDAKLPWDALVWVTLRRP